MTESNATGSETVLEVANLRTVFPTRDGLVVAVDDVSFSVERGKTLGIIGESGSGKSVTARSILRAVERPGRIESGSVRLFGKELLSLPEKEMRRIRGRDIGMIFQDPGASLNPVRKIGSQVIESYLTHRDASRAEARQTVIDALTLAGIEAPEAVLDLYPSDLSSGAKQRVMIAIAIVCRPALLIADEPTTMLGARTQRHILESIRRVQSELQMAMILITHDFGVVSWMADEILVMYGGRSVEHAPKREILSRPRHHYTAGLIRSVPLIDRRDERRLQSIPGFPPDLLNLPSGCIFRTRCEAANDACAAERPPFVPSPDRADHRFACHHPVGGEQ